MNASLSRWLLKCFPASWRVEYGLEFEALLRQQRLGFRDVANVFASACGEQARRPWIKLCISLLTAGALFFTLGLMLSNVVWRAMSSPVNLVLRSHGVRPAALVSVSPWEQAGVVWLGLPLLFTLFALYPCFLLSKSIFITPLWKAGRRRKANLFAYCSCATFLLSLLVGYSLWRHAIPLEVLLDHSARNAYAPLNPLISVADYFALLVSCAFGWTIAWQLPVFLFFALRRRRGH